MPAWGSATLSQALEGTHQSRHNQLVRVREFASRQQLLDRAVGKFKSGIGGSLKGIAVGPDRAPVACTIELRTFKKALIWPRTVIRSSVSSARKCPALVARTSDDPAYSTSSAIAASRMRSSAKNRPRSRWIDEARRLTANSRVLRLPRSKPGHACSCS